MYEDIELSGSKCPNTTLRVQGPKYYDITGTWALKPYYLGPWTLRARVLGTKNLSDHGIWDLRT